MCETVVALNTTNFVINHQTRPKSSANVNLRNTEIRSIMFVLNQWQLMQTRDNIIATGTTGHNTDIHIANITQRSMPLLFSGTPGVRVGPELLICPHSNKDKSLIPPCRLALYFIMSSAQEPYTTPLVPPSTRTRRSIPPGHSQKDHFNYH